MQPASNKGPSLNYGFPDVCLTPVGAVIVPIPYPNFGPHALAVPFSPVVSAAMIPALNQASVVAMTTGDEPGVAHWTVTGPGFFDLGNPVVFVDLIPAINLICQTDGNTGNDQPGMVVAPGAPTVLYTLAHEASAGLGGPHDLDPPRCKIHHGGTDSGLAHFVADCGPWIQGFGTRLPAKNACPPRRAPCDNSLSAEEFARSHAIAPDELHSKKAKPETEDTEVHGRPPHRTLDAEDLRAMDALLASPPLGEIRSLEDGIGLVTIRVFSFRLPAALEGAIARLSGGRIHSDQDALDSPLGLRGLVLDLRGCPGGELLSMLEVARDFLDAGQDITTMTDADGDRVCHRARRPRTHDFPLALLVDAATASAAELFAAALKAHGRAVIIGTPTHGKRTGHLVLRDARGRADLVTAARFSPPDTGCAVLDDQGRVLPDLAPGEDALDAAVRCLLSLASGARALIGDKDSSVRPPCSLRLRGENGGEMASEMRECLCSPPLPTPADRPR